MKISELIKQLENFKNEHGDAPVVTLNEGFGGYGVYLCSGIGTKEKISPWYLMDGGENGNLSNEDILKIIPDWDGKQESLENMNSIICVCIEGKKLIYAS